MLELEEKKLKARDLEFMDQEIKELEVQKLEGCKFIAPRVVEKSSVTFPSSIVNERKASPFANPSSR